MRGFVLAGGESTRMGRNKALLEWNGATLAARMAGMVKKVCGNATVVGDPELYAGLGLTVIPDLVRGQGPLAGIVSALAASDDARNLIVACDMPALGEPFLAGLRDAAEQSDADILLPVSSGGRPEPLCAVYRLHCLGHLRAALERGELKLTAAMNGLAVARRSFPDASVFENVNTPEQWSRFLSTHD